MKSDQRRFAQLLTDAMGQIVEKGAFVCSSILNVHSFALTTRLARRIQLPHVFVFLVAYTERAFS